MTTTTGHSIGVDELVVTRGRSEILRHLSFTVDRGELVGLIGPSGSGKTTLMRSLLGLQRISAGSASLLGLDAGAKGLRQRVGYMAQTPAIYMDLTVCENLHYFAAVLGAPRADEERVLEQVALTEHGQRRVGSLSGGEHTRASLAIALLGAPDILILDEPTVGLDPILRRDLWKTFNQLSENGTTLLVSSHVMDEATRCARLLLLRGGRLLFDGSPDGLLSRTSSPDIDAAFVRLIEDS